MCVCCAGNWTQYFMNARKAHYHWIKSPSLQKMFNSNSSEHFSSTLQSPSLLPSAMQWRLGNPTKGTLSWGIFKFGFWNIYFRSSQPILNIFKLYLDALDWNSFQKYFYLLCQPHPMSGQEVQSWSIYCYVTVPYITWHQRYVGSGRIKVHNI